MTGSRTMSDGPSAAPERSERFRLGNEVLAFRFTATLGERRGDPVERIPSTTRLGAWLRANGLVDDETPVTTTELHDAQQLREAIHRAGTAVASGQAPSPVDEKLLNRWSGHHRAVLTLEAGRTRWQLPAANPVRAALAVIAVDAIAILGDADQVPVKGCERPTCGGLFVDASRGGRRRWCAMATCGNKVKKSNLKARRTPPAHL